MAQKIQTVFIDDLDGSQAEGTVRFGLDGAEYEIDLNARHTKEFRDALARYVGAARRVGGSARKSTRASRRGPAVGLDATEVREWARARGIEVRDRGQVPADLMAKFRQPPASRAETFASHEGCGTSLTCFLTELRREFLQFRGHTAG